MPRKVKVKIKKDQSKPLKHSPKIKSIEKRRKLKQGVPARKIIKKRLV